MAYEARRNNIDDEVIDDSDLKNERNVENNAKNIRAAADVAVSSKNPYATAIGGAVKAADRISGGKSTDFLAKATNLANKTSLAGRATQAGLNKLGESGATNAASKAASIKSSKNGGASNAADTAGKASDAAEKAGDAAEKVSDAKKAVEKKNIEHDNKTTDELNKKTNEALEEQSKKVSEEANKVSDKSKEEGEKIPPEDVDGDKEKKGGILKGIIKIGSIPLIVLTLLLLLPILFLVIIIVIISSMTTSIYAQFTDTISIGSIVGEITDSNYENKSKDAVEFYNRVVEVKNEYESTNRNFKYTSVIAVYYVVNNHNRLINYDYMNVDEIKVIADSMLDENGNYSLEIFRNNLMSEILPRYFPNISESDKTIMVREIIEYSERAEELIKNKKSDTSTTYVANGTCTYNIKNVSSSNGNNIPLNINVTDLHVRLLECDGKIPIAGEELIPFEDYVLGVAFGEISNGYPEEAMKAQMIAARSYALVRPTAMNNAAGLKLEQENGKWILQIRNCVNDQAFCNPDRGCSSASSSCGDASTIHSGHNFATKCVGGAVLAADDKMRDIAASVQGEVLVNAQDSIVYTPFVSTDQNEFKALADQGLDYKQILLQKYNSGTRDMGATSVKKMSCNNVSSGPYANWKQYNGPWTEIKLGDSYETIRSAGCLATSISMLVAKSGVSTTVNGELNPGTFVKKISEVNGFTASGALMWNAVSKVAPNFTLVADQPLVGTTAEKTATIKSILSQGYYPVVRVKYTQHWVAIDSVSGSTVNMLDPGSSSTNLWSEYSPASVTRIVYFKAS